MTDYHTVMDVLEVHDHIEIDFMDYTYEGPRGYTVRLRSDEAVFLLDALAHLFHEVPVPEGSIVFEPERPIIEQAKKQAHLRLVKSEFEDLPRCDGYCADCNHTCPNRAWPLNTEDPKNTDRWCLWAQEPLPLGHSHPHQVEGS